MGVTDRVVVVPEVLTPVLVFDQFTPLSVEVCHCTPRVIPDPVAGRLLTLNVVRVPAHTMRVRFSVASGVYASVLASGHCAHPMPPPIRSSVHKASQVRM